MTAIPSPVLRVEHFPSKAEACGRLFDQGYQLQDEDYTCWFFIPTVGELPPMAAIGRSSEIEGGWSVNYY